MVISLAMRLLVKVDFIAWSYNPDSKCLIVEIGGYFGAASTDEGNKTL